MPDNALLQTTTTAAGLSRYGQIAAELQARIVSGAWAPGSAIPAEGALAKEFGIALGTIRQAIAVLVQQGLL
jgi:GntR family transcriptional regulator